MDEKRAGVWMSVQQGKWRVPSWRSSQFLGKERGPPEVGSWEEPTQLRWIFPPGFRHQNVRRVQRKRERARQSGKKRKFIRGKREGDWLLRRTSVFPFWWSPSYTAPRKNSLKGWSRSWRSGIWWSRSFEKIGASKIKECHLGNLVSLKDHCDLFFVCEVDITSHLINEIPCGPYQA